MEPSDDAGRRIYMNLSKLRRGTSAAAIAGLLTVGVMACGTEQAPGTNGQKPSPSPSTSVAEEQKLTTPITYKRTGGLAGFNDELVVQPDGTATLNGRRDEAFTCQVNKGALAQLGVATNSISSLSTPTNKKKPKTPHPDELYYTLTIDGQTYSTRFDANYDDSVKDVFDMMHRVFTSAVDVREGKKPAAGNSLCTV